MELQNYMEILMWQRLDDVLDSHPGICRWRVLQSEKTRDCRAFVIASFSP